jgi:hypothetical protein
MVNVTEFAGSNAGAARPLAANVEKSKASMTSMVIAREVVLIVIRPLQVGFVLIALN